LIRGEWSGRGREFFGILLFLAPALPFITTLLLYLRESTGRRMAHIMGWVLVNGLWLFLLVTLRSLEFWGVGLLLVTAVSALLLEGAALLRLRRPGKGAA
jgi:hypothetical protein